MSQSPLHPQAFESLVHLKKVGEHNAQPVRQAASQVLHCLRSGGLVFTAGAGHSLGGVIESFHRAGGLAAVRPLYHPELLLFHGTASSTTAERRSGFAAEVLAESGFRGGTDVLVVFSNSGINPFPVEIAMGARQLSSIVVAVTSPAASADAPRRASSTLAEEADIVLDTLVPAGDASYPSDNPTTAPLSSLANAFLWNQLLAELYDAAGQQGVDLPWWRSANTTGGDEANAGHIRHYAGRVPWLR